MPLVLRQRELPLASLILFTSGRVHSEQTKKWGQGCESDGLTASQALTTRRERTDEGRELNILDFQ